MNPPVIATLAAAHPMRPKYNVVSVDDAVRDAGATRYIIKGLLSVNELSVIYGEPASGKSFAALHFGYYVSLNWPVFGRKVKGVPVLYVALEGENGFRRRLAAIDDETARSASFFLITQPADLWSGVGDAEAIVDAAQSVEAGLIIIDTLARAMGCGSENDGADMGRMIAALDFIRRETGAAVLVVHHSGKQSARGMRGHSSLLAAVDTAIEVKRGEDGTRTAKIAKNKDGSDSETIRFDLRVVELGADADGDPITSCVVVEADQSKAVPLTAQEADWFRGLCDTIKDHGGGERIVPGPGQREVFGTPRDVIRDGFRRQGRFTSEPHVPLTQADRSKLRDMLGKLRMKGKIGMTETHIWVRSNA